MCLCNDKFKLIFKQNQSKYAYTFKSVKLFYFILCGVIYIVKRSVSWRLDHRF